MQNLFFNATKSQKFLFSAGFLFGFLYFSITGQININTTFSSRFLTEIHFLLYPLSLACVGLGAAFFSIKEKHYRFTRLTQGSGLMLLLFMTIVFQVPAGKDALYSFYAQFLFLSFYFFFLGIGISQALFKTQKYSLGWMLHLIGILLGYVFSHYALPLLGANVILLMACIFMLFSFKTVLALCLTSTVLIISLLYPLDLFIENYRKVIPLIDRGVVLNASKRSIIPYRILKQGQVYHSSWSEYGQVKIVRQDNRFMCFQSGRRSFRWKKENSENPKSPIFFYKHFGDELLFISGVGGGRNLAILPKTVRSKMFAAERDPGVIRYFSKPNYLFDLSTVKVFNKDSRYVIESSAKKYDVMVFESSKGQKSFTSSQAPYFLYTPEAVASYAKKLLPEGLLVFFFNTGVGKELEKSLTASYGEVSRQVALSIKKSVQLLGMQSYLFRIDKNKSGSRTVFLFASKNLSKWKSKIHLGQTKFNGFNIKRKPIQHFSDNRPFIKWQTIKLGEKNRILFLALFLLILSYLCSLFFFKRERVNIKNGKKHILSQTYFFLVGCIYVSFQLHAFYKYRSFLGDELYTFLRIILYFLVFGAVFSFLVYKKRMKRVYFKYSVFALLVYFFAVFNIPFDIKSYWLRELFLCASIFPIATFCGSLMPLGLDTIKGQTLGLSLLADAMGTLAGYFLIFIVMLPFGINALFYVSFGLSIFLLGLYSQLVKHSPNVI